MMTHWSMMKPLLKIGIATLLILVVLGPDADAQRRRNRGGGGRRAGGRSGAGIGIPGLKKAATWDLSRPAGNLPVAGAGATSSLASKVDRKYEALIKRIEEHLREADRRLAQAQEEGTPYEPPPALDRTEWLALEEPFFKVCDYDGNDWISLREARSSLGIERAEYSVYDTDVDGRVRPGEFGERFRDLIDRTGGFRPPVPDGDGPPPRPRSSEQLRSAYDQNLDAGLGLDELRVLLKDYRREELAVDVVLEKLDWNRSRAVDGDELIQLSRLISASNLMSRMEVVQTEEAGSIRELFGAPTERQEALDSTARPPQLVGPITHFMRLDADGDGLIEPEDLRALQSPLQIKARAGAVLAALDADEDGALSQEELLAALRVQPTREPPKPVTVPEPKPGPVEDPRE